MTASRDLLTFLYRQPGHTLTDASGLLNTRLRELTGYTGSPSGMAQLLSSLDKRGLIERDTAGRRTLRVALTDAGVTAAEESLPRTRRRVHVNAEDVSEAARAVTSAAADDTPTRRLARTATAGKASTRAGQGTEIDLEELAVTLLRKVLAVADLLDADVDVTRLRDDLADTSDALAREVSAAQQLRAEVAALTEKLAQTTAELDAAKAEAALASRGPRRSAASERRHEQIRKLLGSPPAGTSTAATPAAGTAPKKDARKTGGVSSPRTRKPRTG